MATRRNDWTYEEVAMIVGVKLCTGGCGRTKRSHKDGAIEVLPRTIHWTDRRRSRRGLRRFLKLAAAIIDPNARNGPPWRVIYFQNRIAQQLARPLGKMFPREWSAQDRSQIRLSLFKVRYTRGGNPEERERIKEWARP